MILATCPRGIPEILAAETRALGYTVAAVHRAGIEIDAPYEAVYDLNLQLRTAHRVLFRLGSWKCATPDDMYQAVRTVAWEDWIPADGYLSVVSSVDTDEIDNTQFANMRCKDAIVDRIRITKGVRPDSGPRNDQSVVFLFWKGNDCMVYVDTSAKPLSDRGYRLRPGRAPLRESLAAAIVLKSTWNGAGHFVNPMCGSGTLAIEAAMIARNIAPGTLRSDFGLLHLLPTDKDQWEKKRAEAREAIRPMPRDITILASDIDKRAVEITRENAQEAGVARDIGCTVCDFQLARVPEHVEREDGQDVVVMNPEYGIRLGNEDELVEVYRSIGDFFKQKCAGYMGYVFTGNMNLTKQVGLRAKQRIPFWTADIECRLLEFELYK